MVGPGQKASDSQRERFLRVLLKALFNEGGRKFRGAMVLSAHLGKTYSPQNSVGEAGEG
jgi:hypothetical protein